MYYVERDRENWQRMLHVKINTNCSNCKSICEYKKEKKLKIVYLCGFERDNKNVRFWTHLMKHRQIIRSWSVTASKVVKLTK